MVAREEQREREFACVGKRVAKWDSICLSGRNAKEFKGQA
jgi:hypothetical protein